MRTNTYIQVADDAYPSVASIVNKAVSQAKQNTNGFEYEIREVNRCVKLGYCSSDVYTAKDSIALTRLMYDIRMSWNMIFDGEIQA